MPTIDSLPTPRTPDPREAPSLRWGILGPGWIAHRFVESLQAHTTQRVVAVGSRGRDRAESFAAQWSVPTVHDSYDALFGDPDVDIVYIATPHPSHRDNAIAALEAGKHVLVEKPLAVDAAGAREIVTAAARADRFVGEAMWTKFLPKFGSAAAHGRRAAARCRDVHTLRQILAPRKCPPPKRERAFRQPAQRM